jgi:hypothetical protein
MDASVGWLSRPDEEGNGFGTGREVEPEADRNDFSIDVVRFMAMLMLI